MVAKLLADVGNNPSRGRQRRSNTSNSTQQMNTRATRAAATPATDSASSAPTGFADTDLVRKTGSPYGTWGKPSRTGSDFVVLKGIRRHAQSKVTDFMVGTPATISGSGASELSFHLVDRGCIVFAPLRRVKGKQQVCALVAVEPTSQDPDYLPQAADTDTDTWDRIDRLDLLMVGVNHITPVRRPASAWVVGLGPLAEAFFKRAATTARCDITFITAPSLMKRSDAKGWRPTNLAPSAASIREASSSSDEESDEPTHPTAKQPILPRRRPPPALASGLNALTKRVSLVEAATADIEQRLRALETLGKTTPKVAAAAALATKSVGELRPKVTANTKAAKSNQAALAKALKADATAKANLSGRITSMETRVGNLPPPPAAPSAHKPAAPATPPTEDQRKLAEAIALLAEHKAEKELGTLIDTVVARVMARITTQQQMHVPRMQPQMQPQHQAGGLQIDMARVMQFMAAAAATRGGLQ
jgi:hypothetical protein